MIMERFGRGGRAARDGGAGLAPDGMPLAADGRRLDELLWRKMDLALGSLADRDEAMAAIDAAIESAGIGADGGAAYFGARAARDGGLPIWTRNARESAAGRMEGAMVSWSGGDLLARGVAPGRFGAITAIMGAEAWRAIAGSPDFTPAAFPEISMSIEDGYEFAAADGAEAREGPLPMRTISARLVVRRDGRVHDWRRSGAEIRRIVRRRLIDGIHRSILWDDCGAGAALLARSADGDLMGGGMEVSRIALDLESPFGRAGGAAPAAMEAWGNVETADLLAVCHWTDKRKVQEGLGLETFAPRAIPRGLGSESADVCAVIIPRSAFRFGLRSLPWIYLADDGDGAVAVVSSVTIGFGAEELKAGGIGE